MRTALMSMCRREYCLASYTAYPDEERSGALSPPSQGSLMPHNQGGRGRVPREWLVMSPGKIGDEVVDDDEAEPGTRTLNPEKQT
jgi:hypothetical protein